VAELVIIGVLVGWDAMFELHPVEGVNYPLIPAFHEKVLFGVRHPVEIDLLSPKVTERSPEGQVCPGKLMGENRIVSNRAQALGVGGRSYFSDQERNARNNGQSCAIA
jgi:hypothetical protein